MYGYTAFRGSIGLIPYFYGCRWQLKLAAFPEPYKIIESGFICLAFHTVYDGITAAFMRLRTT